MNETKDEIITILHNCYEKIKQLEIAAIASTTFVLAIYEDGYDYVDFKKAISRFSGVEKKLYGCLYDRNGYNEYYIQIKNIDDLALLQQKLGARLFIDFSGAIPVITLEDEV